MTKIASHVRVDSWWRLVRRQDILCKPLSSPRNSWLHCQRFSFLV